MARKERPPRTNECMPSTFQSIKVLMLSISKVDANPLNLLTRISYISICICKCKLPQSYLRSFCNMLQRQGNFCEKNFMPAIKPVFANPGPNFMAVSATPIHQKIN